MVAPGTDSFVVAGLLPEIARDFNVSIGAAGQMTTAYAVTIALLAPIIAALAAHVPRKRLLLPWTSANLWMATLAVLLLGACV